MISPAAILSLAFFLASVFYAMNGTYVFSFYRRSARDTVFLLLCVSLCLWTFSFSIANTAPDLPAALLWRRIAAVGSCTLFSLLLHYTLSLTGHDELLRRKWVILPIYLPAALGVFAFSAYGPLTASLFALSHTALGWVNTGVTLAGWHLFYLIYATAFSGASLVLLVVWGVRKKERSTKKTARLLSAALLAMALFTGVSDIVFGSFLSSGTTHLMPLVFAVPASAAFWSIARYDGSKPDIKSRRIVEGEILTERSRARAHLYSMCIYLMLGLVYVAVSFFNKREHLSGVLPYGGLIILFGLVLQMIDTLKAAANRKNRLAIAVIAVSIPILTLMFIPILGTTIWAIPAIWLVFAVLFNNRKGILFLALVFIATQACVLFFMPEAVPDTKDLILRIILFAVLVITSVYVNKVFISRLREYEKQTYEQKLISKISNDFINVSEVNFGDLISGMLELTGRHSNASGAYFFAFPEDREPISLAFEWSGDGTEPILADIRALLPETIAWIKSNVTDISVFNMSNLESLPPEASELKDIVIKQKIKSMLITPVSSKGSFLGIYGLNTTDGALVWGEDKWNMMRVMADILANALIKLTAENEVHRMAFYDMLTGLPNRALFRNRLDYEMKKSNRTEKLIGVVFLDLDNFKYINDTIGHKGGDEFLKQVSARLSQSIREIDTISRFGGDEFLFMLTNIGSENDIEKITGKILNSISQPVTINGQEYIVTASAGIAIYPTDGYDTETLIKNADLAMYSSKSQGKNIYSFCSLDMKNEALEKMKLRNSLYRAQERRELVILYQPQVEIKTRQIVGLEALIRWDHPHLGQILPDKFLPLAEQTGLINPIGEWLLEAACLQNVAWMKMGMKPLRIAVNLSGEQLRDPHIVDIVSKILTKTGLKPECLELEITASMAIKNPNGIMKTLSRLKKLGVLIAIDDFGTDYSSFLQLKLLSVDSIKMDMQFTQGIASNKKDEAIVKGIIQLAKNLDIKVTAEGVETEVQYAFLHRHGCDQAQGYYLYKPMSEDETRAILINGQQ